MKPEFKLKKQKSGGYSLEVKGDLVVQYSTAFRDHLAECLNSKGNLEISLLGITSIDISALQLIQIIRNEFKGTKQDVSIIAPENSAVLELLNKCGLMQIIGQQS